MHMLRAAAICGAALLLSATAWAQNMSLRAPDWAQALLSSDIIPTTGGRAVLAAEGIPTSVRVTIAPRRGGVARVIRYDVREGAGATLALRRFTGHPSTGWWLWGSDAPRVTPVPAAQQQDIANMARALLGVSGAISGDTDTCATGEQAYIEIASGGRSTSIARNCITQADVAGRLTLRLSELAGSRTEEELAAAAVAELLEADRAFAAMARADGVAAAFAHYAASDAIVASSDAVASGREGVTQRFATWPQGARLERTPESARVSSRGDMGWTYGALVQVAADGTRTSGRYVSVWTRDYEGAWRYAFDAPIR
jgi:ketosteroid isomerase-like protein